MDPEAVIREARGDVDEALLTRTDGGFLGRNVLADEPLLAHLREEETLHYLLAGAAAPTRVEDGTAEELSTTGGFRTLLAVTDARLLVVAGSADGDRAVEFEYGDLLDVRHEPGLVTDAVIVEEGAGRAWEVAVGSGSDPAAAVEYARDRLGAVEATPSARDELVAAVFERLVADAGAGFGVEQYDDDGLTALVEDLQAHHDRLRDRLAAGDLEAARGAAATVDDVAAEGERLAERRDRPEIGRRVAATRREARRALVAAAFGVEDPADLEGTLAPALKRLLRGIDADEFERFVADLWSEHGFQTAVTRSNKDEGVDVVARRSTPVEETWVIQAKRYGPDTKVGRPEVQQYAGLHRQEPDADLVVVVTTGEFTGPAHEAAPDLGVKLVDGDRLVEMVREEELYDLVAAYVGDGGTGRSPDARNDGSEDAQGARDAAGPDDAEDGHDASLGDFGGN